LVVFYRIFEDPAHQVVYSAVHCLVFKDHLSRLHDYYKTDFV